MNYADWKCQDSFQEQQDEKENNCHFQRASVRREDLIVMEVI